jgi:UMP-CMP kinase
MSSQTLPTLDRTAPLFGPDSDAAIIFVLGGPGSGKGTQCERLVRHHGFQHFSAGDLLREEQERPGSPYGDLIRGYITSGTIVPMEITIKLLEAAIAGAMAKGARRFLVDGEYRLTLESGLTGVGFPRKMDQAIKFEEVVAVSKFTLFLECPEDVMLQRLLKRGQTSGRADDNEEVIKKRFKTFVDTTMPVVNYFDSQGRVVKVSAVQSPDEVEKEIEAEFKKRGIDLK